MFRYLLIHFKEEIKMEIRNYFKLNNEKNPML